MKTLVWEKYQDQTIEGIFEILFIDESNRICQGSVASLPVKGITVLAYRSLEALKPEPTAEKKFVCYWNWKKGKFWPFNTKSPPNPKLPYYFRVEISYNDPKDIKYFIHSEVIV
jgi:hypothetical protein